MKNNKFIPNPPKTFQVLELRDQRQEQQIIKKSPLSLAARSKIINKSGSNYLSFWMETSINEAVGYGPVFRWCSDCAISRDVSETTHKCPICRVIFSEVAEQHERNKEAEKRSGGKASYSYKYDGYGNTIETAIYDNNEKLTNLYMGCPASNCRNITSSHYYHSSGLNASNHSGCGSLLISNKGNINCSSCGTSSTVRNWKFNCSYHSEYRTTSSISFLRSLTVAADLSSESGMLKELRNYLINNNW